MRYYEPPLGERTSSRVHNAPGEYFTAYNTTAGTVANKVAVQLKLCMHCSGRSASGASKPRRGYDQNLAALLETVISNLEVNRESWKGKAKESRPLTFKLQAEPSCWYRQADVYASSHPTVMYRQLEEHRKRVGVATTQRQCRDLMLWRPRVRWHLQLLICPIVVFAERESSSNAGGVGCSGLRIGESF